MTGKEQWDSMTPNEQQRLGRLFRLILKLRREGKIGGNREKVTQ